VLAIRQTVENLEPDGRSRYFGGRMRLRYILRKYSRYRSYIWPPAGPYGTRSGAWEGILTEVRRIGDRLSLTVRIKGADHVTLLDEWNAPPSVDAVEVALVRMIGRTILAVGEVEVGGTPSAPIVEDKHGY
jgi:hypothetical protein